MTEEKKKDEEELREEELDEVTGGRQRRKTVHRTGESERSGSQTPDGLGSQTGSYTDDLNPPT